jgi:hypothetical protein
MMFSPPRGLNQRTDPGASGDFFNTIAPFASFEATRLNRRVGWFCRKRLYRFGAIVGEKQNSVIHCNCPLVLGPPILDWPWSGGPKTMPPLPLRARTPLSFSVLTMV